MSAIDHYINAIMERAAAEARQDGSAAIEAHHLLLGIATHGGTAAATALTAAGLTPTAIRQALDGEFEHSLSTVGVSPSAFTLPHPTPDPDRTPGMGASTRLAFERGFAWAPRKKDLRPAHVLLGILEADLGTVPRALRLAGIDRDDLRARVQEAAEEPW